jgi:tRNA(Ile)-lysidine synthase
MLSVTREEVLAFLDEYSIPHIEDSSNAGDDFLRNRLRHSVMPLLGEENPGLARNLSAMALRLRQDEQALEDLARESYTNQVSCLQAMQPAIRSRVLAKFLREAGVKEPEATHLAALENLVYSDKPSARAAFPGGVTVVRDYDQLVVCPPAEGISPLELTDSVILSGYRITCRPNCSSEQTPNSFAIVPQGKILVRGRAAGDTIRLNAGTKTLKKLFIDKKIPARLRDRIPVIADEGGVLGIAGIGANVDRLSDDQNAVRITIENI